MAGPVKISELVMSMPITAKCSSRSSSRSPFTLAQLLVQTMVFGGRLDSGLEMRYFKDVSI